MLKTKITNSTTNRQEQLKELVQQRDGHYEKLERDMENFDQYGNDEQELLMEQAEEIQYL